MKMNIARRLASLALLTLLASGAVVTGCGGASVSSLCDDVCACTTCTTAEHDSCVTQGEQLQATADKAGCSGQFDDVLSCSHANAKCSGGSEKTCEPQLNAFDACIGKK
jgi:hypothetical protein